MAITRRSFVIGSVGATAMAGASGLNASSANSPVALDTLPFSTPPGADQPLVLDLFRPKGATRPLPVILFAHGGAWILGDRHTAPDLRRYFAREGFAMASLEYRLAPRDPFPAAVEDVRTAVRWLRANAKQLGLDPGRIGLWGTSAGAHLVSMAGLLPPDRFAGVEYPGWSSAVSCVLDGYGPTDLSKAKAQLAEEKSKLEPVVEPIRALPNIAVEQMNALTPAMLETLRNADQAYLGAPLESIPETVHAANPARYARRDAPPFLIMHGLSDSSVAIGQSVLLYEALAAADADVTLRLVHGLPHTFFNLPNIDDVAGPFAMDVRRHQRGKVESHSTDTAKVFDVAHAFFQTHLK